MSLTRNGMSFAETMPTSDINALVFYEESVVLPHFSNGYVTCRLPRAKGKPYIGSCVFELSFKHKSQYLHCVTRIEQSQITLFTAAKMLKRMWANQIKHYQHCKSHP